MFKMKIEEEDFQKQQAWLEQRIEENKSSKKEQERETATFIYKFDEINDQL